MLDLAGPQAGERSVDVPANSPEGLPQQRGLLLEPIAVAGGQAGEQPAIEIVAVARDPGQKIAQRHGCLGRPWPMAGEPRGHQHHASEHGRRFPAEFRLRVPAARAACCGPGQDPVERGLLHDHPPIPALFIDPGRIPEPEEIVGPAGGRMHEVEGPRIDREFLEHLKLEVGLPEQLGRCRCEDVEGPGDKVAISAMGWANAGYVERNRPHPLVRIGRRQPPVFKDRHRSPADVVVEAIDRAGDELAGIVGRGIHGGGFRE